MAKQQPQAPAQTPPLHYGPSGVLRVKAADILKSVRGQEQIRKAAAVAVALKLRPSAVSAPKA